MRFSKGLSGICLAAAALTGIMCAQAPVERVPPPSAVDPSYVPPPPAYAAPLTDGPTRPAYPGPPAGGAPQPPGVAEAFADLTSQPATHSSFTLDRDMLRAVLGNQLIALNAVTVTNYHYQAPAFYVPEALAALRGAYGTAGWKHLVEAHVTPREDATPLKPITDVWLHFRGAEIDDVAVLIRASRQMNVVQVSGLFRPLDLVHLGGHFGIPKVDPDTVMVPAPPGR